MRSLPMRSLYQIALATQHVRGAGMLALILLQSLAVNKRARRTEERDEQA